MKTAKADGVVRFTVSVPRDLAKQLDEMTREKDYANRSLAVAGMIRAGLIEHRQNLANQEIAGTITLVYDHHKTVTTQARRHFQTLAALALLLVWPVFPPPQPSRRAR